MIDLHLHTTASDGRCSAAELVARAADAGLTIIAATDHDTTAAVAEVDALAASRGIRAIPGIEITAVENGADIHVLAYFLDTGNPALQTFLEAQRQSRLARIDAIAARLSALGLPIDVRSVLAESQQQTGRALGRPQIARAMIAAGYLDTVQEAFERWLGKGCPAFVPRTGAPTASVIATIHAAGGIASLAHPGRTRVDEHIPRLRDAGLDAIEVFHSDHDAATVARYARMASGLGLLATGGSDFHGDPSRTIRPGSATLPQERWPELWAARTRHA